MKILEGIVEGISTLGLARTSSKTWVMLLTRILEMQLTVVDQVVSVMTDVL